ncbi:MAG: hypothetical protein NWR99_13910 [Verrucomicrobiales bacterium]|jgi:hypothetical protein|nr:hypothetical protein [Verrucomicrobiales bacterium]
MTDPIASRTLELASTVGSLDDAREALEDGADVNFRSGAPLFLAIVNRNRPIINFLLDNGADSERFIPGKKLKQIRSREDLIEELVSCAPFNPRDLKIEELQEIDSGIREVGVEFLVSELDWDNATRFRDTLNAIGAGSKHRCVAEFLQWARSESRAGSGIERFLDSHGNAVSEYRDRYLSIGEDLIALASDFLNSPDGTGAD